MSGYLLTVGDRVFLPVGRGEEQGVGLGEVHQAWAPDPNQPQDDLPTPRLVNSASPRIEAPVEYEEEVSAYPWYDDPVESAPAVNVVAAQTLAPKPAEEEPTPLRSRRAAPIQHEEPVPLSRTSHQPVPQDELGCGKCADCRNRLRANPYLKFHRPIGNIQEFFGEDDVAPAAPWGSERSIEVIKPASCAQPVDPDSLFTIPMARPLIQKSQVPKLPTVAPQQQPVKLQTPVKPKEIPMRVDLSTRSLNVTGDSTPSTPVARKVGYITATPDTWSREMIERGLKAADEPRDREVHFFEGLITSCCPNACEDPDDSDDEDGREYCQSCGAWGPLFLSLRPYWHGFLRCLIDSWKCISNLFSRGSEEEQGKNAIEMSIIKTPRNKDFKQEQN